MKQYERLKELGKEPISLPAEINFAGNVILQKAHCDNDDCKPGACWCGKGMHHKPEYQKTGTYMHPNLVRQRLREANDRLNRFKAMKMSETEKRTYASAGIKQLQEALETAKKDYEEVMERHIDRELTASIAPLFSPPKATSVDQSVPQANIPVSPLPETKKEETVTATVSTTVESKPTEELYANTSLADEIMKMQPEKKKIGRPPKAKIEAEPVNPDETDIVTQAALAAKARPMEDMKSF